MQCLLSFFLQISHFLNEIQTDRLFLSGISFFCIIAYNTLENYLQTLQEIHNAELHIAKASNIFV